MPKLILPDAPAHLTGPVKAWSEPVVIPTYRPMAPDKNPMFLEKRVYQGSSGRVYPLPFIDRIDDEKVDQSWSAIHLENEFIRLMILPEIGGRIHIGLDKTNGYDFFYRQEVIKPALVGLAGPWISGGVEFNWPQHHRPSTFMPTDVQIEEHADGSVTVWCSEHEPMNRMKGMHGVCLRPGKAVVELKARLYNRTELTQTFLWWANVATRVHERYQSFFPPDVRYVADHAKRATSRFPRCEDHYYGVDYGRRSREGVPANETPAQFVPTGEYPANDLSWYANIPVPTSYMAMGSNADFFGGYDHALGTGLVHVASRHVSPGKKQWTWGNHEFGYAWDRNLTDPDEDGICHPYIELMAGVFTDNQPDFSFLAPGETKTFTQFWYPVQKIGPASAANVEAAVSLVCGDGVARIGVGTTAALRGADVRLRAADRVVKEWRVDLSPDRPLVETIALSPADEPSEMRVEVLDNAGRVLIEYRTAQNEEIDVPAPATEPPLPQDITTNDELYLTGLHLEQYRHATRMPDGYWREALRRDPADCRCNNAMGSWHLRRGEFEAAETHFRRAIATLTRRNPNPYDGEPSYNLGLTLRHLGRYTESYDAFYKAAWNAAWKAPAFLALAEIDCRSRRWEKALEHVDRALSVSGEHLLARNLRAIVLRRLNREEEADGQLRATLALDPLDPLARHLTGQEIPGGTEVRLDLALDLSRAGLYGDAVEVLTGINPTAGTAPLVHYYRAYFLSHLNELESAKQALNDASSASLDYCFPARLEDVAVLRAAIAANPTDAHAPYLLGNLFYDRRRHEEAITLWEQSARLDPNQSICWRNLGIGYFNIRGDATAALAAYDRAAAADKDDARVFFERDQLWKRVGESPQRRLEEMRKHVQLVGRRDDLTVEFCALLNQVGKPQEAQDVLKTRHFQPWEGGEGLALGQHVRTNLALGRQAMADGDAAKARQYFETALASPQNLGEAKHLLMNQSDIHYWIGVAADAQGDREAATRHWTIAAETRGDFQDMSVRAFSEMTVYSAMSLRALGRSAEATRLLHELFAYAQQLEATPAKIDYFATSLPTMLLFDVDLQQRQTIQAQFLAAQAKFGLGDEKAARAILERILTDDPNHAPAFDFLTTALRASE